MAKSNGVETEPRERRFMRSALAILGETGRTDFTVLEVVERSKTSLPVEALRVLIDRICTPAESSTQDRVNRGLTYYNDHLAETLPREYARVLAPVHELIKDIINRGIADGSFRAGIDVDATAALIMQTALGAMRLQVLGAELSGVPVDANHIYDFSVAALLDNRAPVNRA
jgi:hypothetical protein